MRMHSLSASQKTTLSALGEFRNGVNFGKGLKGNGIGLINVKDIFRDSPKVDFDSLDLVNLADSRGIDRYFVEEGDIFFVRSSVKRDGIGFVAHSDRRHHGAVHCGFVIRFRPDQTKVDYRFLTYALRSQDAREMIRNLSGGAAITNISQEALRTLPLSIPPLPIQQIIAGILSAYDELIENSQRRIMILESIARNLYREWFVHFRFPGHETHLRVSSSLGEIPQGWEVKTVKQILARRPAGSVYRNADVKPEGDVPVIDQSTNEMLGFHDNAPDHNASSTLPMAIFGDHTCKMQLLIEPFSIGPNVVPFLASQGLPTAYVFHAVNSLVHTQEYKRHWISLTSKEVVVADPVTAQRFASHIQPLLVTQETHRKAIRNLRRARDFLLPRLLSGQINVETIE